MTIAHLILALILKDVDKKNFIQDDELEKITNSYDVGKWTENEA